MIKWTNFEISFYAVVEKINYLPDDGYTARSSEYLLIAQHGYMIFWLSILLRTCNRFFFLKPDLQIGFFDPYKVWKNTDAALVPLCASAWFTPRFTGTNSTKKKIIIIISYYLSIVNHHHYIVIHCIDNVIIGFYNILPETVYIIYMSSARRWRQSVGGREIYTL